MSNFFSFDSSYQYEPIIKQLDPKVVDKDMDSCRQKIMDAIKQVVDQKDLSRSELALAARISRAIAGQVYRGNADKISTDRLMRIARRLGLKAKVKFVAEA
jgi:predicted XRE-type DNA-binding protein